MVIDITEKEKKVRSIVNQLHDLIRRTPNALDSELPVSEHSLDAIEERIDKPFVLGVLGEFRTGKSTLINSLTGFSLALTDVLETTATLNEYRYGPTTSAKIFYKDAPEDNILLADLNVLLDQKRHDQDWLPRIHHISVTAPSNFLTHFSIWDAPGLGGSENNETLALSFLEEVDAAIWVFDIDFLGAQRLQSALDELGRRGKSVIAVLNKAEGWSDNEIAGAFEFLERAHDGLVFRKMFAFSALRAWDTSINASALTDSIEDAVGSDGGKKQLVSYLLGDLLTEPKLLTIQAAAGDIASIGSTLQQFYEERASFRRRNLWLYKQQEISTKKIISHTAEDLTRNICDGLEQRLPDDITREIEKAVSEASDDNICNTEWRQQLILSILEESRLLAIVQAYMDERSSWIGMCWQEAIAGIQKEFNSVLTLDDLPAYQSSTDFENNTIHIDMPQIESTSFTGTSSHTGMSQGDKIKVGAIGTAAISVVSGLAAARDAITAGTSLMGILSAFSNGALAGATIAGSLAVAFAPLLGVAASVVGPKILSALLKEFQKGAETPDTMRDKIVNETGAQISSWCSQELRPRIEANIIAPYFDKGQETLTELIIKEAQSNIFGAASLQDVTHEEQEFSALAAEANVLVDELYKISGVNSQAMKSNSLLSEARTFLSSDRAGLERLLERIFSSARSRLDIVDKSFASENFMLLRHCNELMPIHLLTHEQPRSNFLRADFTAALSELRQRPGPVRVRVPSVGVEQVFPQTETGTWVFTDSGAFSFSHSLSFIGSLDITVSPIDDNGELRNARFTQWWNETVEGVQMQDIR